MTAVTTIAGAATALIPAEAAEAPYGLVLDPLLFDEVFVDRRFDVGRLRLLIGLARLRFRAYRHELVPVCHARQVTTVRCMINPALTGRPPRGRDGARGSRFRRHPGGSSR